MREDQVWIGTESRKILIFSASDPEKGRILGTADLPQEILSMTFHAEAVWVGLSEGQIAVFRRNIFTLAWDLQNPYLIDLGTPSDPVLSLLPMIQGSQGGLYAACGKRVCVIDVHTNEILKSFVIQPRNDSSSNFVHQMAQSGVGLWVALKNSATICLYHTETFRHLQDINIASNVSRVLAARDVTRPQRSIHVTALMASRGLLWVGTNVGIALTVPLPRLEGVPIISGRANISYHAHFGSVTFFLNLQHKVLTTEVQSNSQNNCMIREESEKDLEELEKVEKLIPVEEKPKISVPKLRHRNSSPILKRRPQLNHVPNMASRRSSKTLPRGFSLANQNDSQDCDVFGLYGELLNVRDYDCDSGERIAMNAEELRKSDPELSTIPYR